MVVPDGNGDLIGRDPIRKSLAKELAEAYNANRKLQALKGQDRVEFYNSPNVVGAG